MAVFINHILRLTFILKIVTGIVTRTRYAQLYSYHYLYPPREDIELFLYVRTRSWKTEIYHVLLQLFFGICCEKVSTLHFYNQFE